MAKVIFKVKFEAGKNKEMGKNEDEALRESVNNKFSAKIVEYVTVPRIGEWIDLLKLSDKYDLSHGELTWLSSHEHKFRIENVNKCDGYIEAELDIDKVWPEEA